MRTEQKAVGFAEAGANTQQLQTSRSYDDWQLAFNVVMDGSVTRLWFAWRARACASCRASTARTRTLWNEYFRNFGRQYTLGVRYSYW